VKLRQGDKVTVSYNVDDVRVAGQKAHVLRDEDGDGMVQIAVTTVTWVAADKLRLRVSRVVERESDGR
jgi:hypothetical protein